MAYANVPPVSLPDGFKVNIGVGDDSADVSVAVPFPTVDLTSRELLELIYTELREMNFHLTVMTGESVEADL